MSSREAERKARQRGGYAHWQIEVHPPTFKAALLAEGMITERRSKIRMRSERPRGTSLPVIARLAVC